MRLQNLGVPSPKTWALFSGGFQTTLRLKCEYRGNETHYRQKEKRVLNDEQSLTLPQHLEHFDL